MALPACDRAAHPAEHRRRDRSARPRDGLADAPPQSPSRPVGADEGRPDRPRPGTANGDTGRGGSLPPAQAWGLFAAHYQRVIHKELTADEQWRRLRLALDLFRSTRCRSAVMNNGNHDLGLVLHWAFDVPNQKIHDLARSAMIEAGYEEEYNREAQKRALDAISTAILDGEKSRSALMESLRTLETQHSGALAEWHASFKGHHEVLGDFEVATTEGKLRLTHLQVDLYEVRKELEAALDRLRIEEGALRQLRSRIREQNLRANAELEQVSELVGEQRRVESDLARARKELSQAQSDRQRWEREVDRCQQELRRLERNPPREPRRTGDANTDNSQMRRYQAETHRHAENCRNLDHEIRSSREKARRSETLASESQIAIRRSEDRIARLQRSIDEVKQRLSAIQSRLAGLRADYELRREQCEQLRRLIASLQARVDDLDAQRRAQEQADRERQARLGADERTATGDQPSFEPDRRDPQRDRPR